MNSDVIITAAVLVVAVAAFISNRIPPGLVALGVALTLYVSGVLTPEQAIAGFGDSVIVFIAALFVVSEGLDATGVTTWAGQQLMRRAGNSPRRLVLAIMLLVAVLSALISVNGAVAALLPMVMVLAVRVGRPPSQLLLPTAFGAHAGSLLVLTGTPVTVLIADFIVDTGAPAPGYFAIGLIGLPLLVGTVLICVLLGPRLLPYRTPKTATRDLSAHAATLTREYELDATSSVIDREIGLTEVVVPPRSSFIGEEVYPGQVTESGELVIVAIQRSGQNMGPTRLRAGDIMVLRGTWPALDVNTLDENVIVIDTPQSVRRQAVPFGPRAKIAVVILAAMVILLATGLVQPAIGALLAAVAMVLTRVIGVSQATQSISWTTLILVGGMIPLSTAIEVSGAADLIADVIVTTLGTAGPHLLLLGIVLVTAILGQLISNMATALIVAPIAIAIAAEAGISPVPLLMGVAVAAAAAFLTPVATPANTMVFVPGGYRFGDYWKLGLPLLVMFVAAATLLVPVFWPF